MTWTIEERPWADPVGTALRLAQRAELDERYGCDDHEPGGPPSASDIDLFLIATESGNVPEGSVATETGNAPESSVATENGNATGGSVAAESGNATEGGRIGGGAAVGCGALRRLDEHTAEVKRMYVVPASRGSGVATAILRALEEAAVRRGWTTLRLETGSAQPEAVRFYRREGYREIPLYGVYVDSEISLCFERDLRQPAARRG